MKRRVMIVPVLDEEGNAYLGHGMSLKELQQT